MSTQNKISTYLENIHPPIHKTMKEIKQLAKKKEVPIVNDELGRLLCLLTQLQKPKKILELGTGFSYSTHWLLLGNPESRIISVDCNKERMQIAQKFLTQSNLLYKVKLYTQWERDFFLHNKEKFDMVFLDSQKSSYPKTLEMILPCLKKNGLLVVDNSLFRKLVLLSIDKVEKKYSNAVQAIQTMNQKVFQRKDLKGSIFSLGDGVLIVQKI